MGKSEDVFNVERIRQLIDLMEERGLNEVELKQEDQHIRLVRGLAMAQAAVAPAAVPVAAASVPEPTPQAIDGPHIKVITAPMVGTFYDKPNPNAEPFVKIGSKVSADTVVCIVEAMKVFNEIPAEVKGTVVEVLAGNEEAVDFGRPLFKVDTRS
ncbi:MAG: acetyl-CoA carboxylase biotin carboxyl carrier protein [bacterium]|nr:acetyl-CoA carboxylase biotin carboxyl carrier protein [bacterium]